MKHNMQKSLRKLLFLTLTLVVVSATALLANPVAAQSIPVAPPQAQSPALSVKPSVNPNPFSVSPRSGRRTVGTSLVKVEFQSGGLYVAARFVANNLKGETVRMALFLGWGDGTWMDPNPDTPAEYISSGGSLTQQFTDVAPYTNTEWKYVEFYIPWGYFPRVNQNTTVFLVTYVGLDGQEFVDSSYRQYFVLYPPTE
jgi:hypothetical protein